MICNEEKDCVDNSDETVLCYPQLCPKHSFRCSYGKCIDKKTICDNFNDCIDGSDETDLLCKSLSCLGVDCDLYCPSITSNRLITTCEYDQKEVPCDTAGIKPNTISKYSCKEFYKPSNALNQYNNESICQKDGQWSTNILKCDPKCGYLNTALPLIVNGFDSDTIFPWHVTMFMRTNNNQWTLACGGSLISESVILTASHCFNNLNESDVKFAVGKLLSNYTINTMLEPNARIYDVKRIIRHPLYLDKIGNYGSDIALVELNASIPLSDEIHPVCIDWDLDDITSHLSHSQMGVIVGMGINENDTNSQHIRMVKLPVVSNEDCVKKEPRDFQKYVTFTTFCAGWGNGKCHLF